MNIINYEILLSLATW